MNETFLFFFDLLKLLIPPLTAFYTYFTVVYYLLFFEGVYSIACPSCYSIALFCTGFPFQYDPTVPIVHDIIPLRDPFIYSGTFYPSIFISPYEFCLINFSDTISGYICIKPTFKLYFIISEIALTQRSLSISE